MRELLVLTDVRRNDPANLSVYQQLPKPYAVGSTVVGDDLQVGDPQSGQSVDEDRGNAADPKTTAGDNRTLGDIGNGLSRRDNDLVHSPSPSQISFASCDSTVSGTASAGISANRKSPVDALVPSDSQYSGGTSAPVTEDPRMFTPSLVR